MKKNNGLLPGWPPFTDFKREIVDLMSDLIEEKNKPIKQDLDTVKQSLVEYIYKTNANFKSVDENFKSVDENFKSVDENFKSVDENFKEVKLALSNHITDTNKKITALQTEVKEVNVKLDRLLSKPS